MTAIAIERIRTLIETCERTVKPSGMTLTPLLRRDGVIMELVVRDDFGVSYTGGRHFGWDEIATMEPPKIADVMRWAIKDLYRTVHATTE